MNLQRTVLMLTIFFLTTGLSAQDVLFQSSFDSDDGFVALPSSDDSEFEFNYDYADFDDIPEAPSSARTGGNTRRGLKLEANISEGAFSAIAVATVDLELSGQYAVQVDAWLNFNFPAGAAGTTEFGGLAVGHDAETLGFNGASLIYDTDGDSASDYRLYKDSTFQTLDTGQYAVESLNNTSEPFVSSFPGVDIAAAAPEQAVNGTTQSGSGGFRWMTLEALVDTNAVGSGVTEVPGVATFSITDADSGNKVEIGSIDNSNGIGVVSMSGNVAVIFSDIFSSVSNDQSLSFGIFDNLIVTSVASSLPLDCNDDGVVDSNDVSCATADTIGEALGSIGLIAGDLDLNGKVEFADFLALSANFGDTSKGGVYANGDVDLNGAVEFADFLTLSNNFGREAGVTNAVPEPAACGMFVLGLALATFKRSKKRAVV